MDQLERSLLLNEGAISMMAKMQKRITELEEENERLKKQVTSEKEDGFVEGMERAAEIAWKLHCSGPPNSIHTAYDASNAIRAELETKK